MSAHGDATLHPALKRNVDLIRGEPSAEQIDDDKLAYEKEAKTRERTLEQLGSKIETEKENLEKITSETADIKRVKAALFSDLEQIEETVERNEYLKTMTVLMAESNISLDWKTVQRAAIPFFNGFIEHIRTSRNKYFYTSILSSAITIRDRLLEGARNDSWPET